MSKNKKIYSYINIENDKKNKFLLSCQDENLYSIFLDFQKKEIKEGFKEALHYVRKLIKLKEDILIKRNEFDYRIYRRKNLHRLKDGKKYKVFNLQYLCRYLGIEEINENFCYEYDDFHRTVLVYPSLKDKMYKKKEIASIPLFPSISNIDLFFQDFNSLRNLIRE